MRRSHRLVPAVVHLQIYVTVMRETTTRLLFLQTSVASPTAVVATTTLVRLWVLAFGFMVKREMIDSLATTNKRIWPVANTFVCNQEGEDIIVDYRSEQDGDVIENQVLR